MAETEKLLNLKHLKLPHAVFHFIKAPINIDKLYLGEVLKIAKSQIELRIRHVKWPMCNFSDEVLSQTEKRSEMVVRSDLADSTGMTSNSEMLLRRVTEHLSLRHKRNATTTNLVKHLPHSQQLCALQPHDNYSAISKKTAWQNKLFGITFFVCITVKLLTSLFFFLDLTKTECLKILNRFCNFGSG